MNKSWTFVPLPGRVLMGDGTSIPPTRNLKTQLSGYRETFLQFTTTNATLPNLPPLSPKPSELKSNSTRKLISLPTNKTHSLQTLKHPLASTAILAHILTLLHGLLLLEMQIPLVTPTKPARPLAPSAQQQTYPKHSKQSTGQSKEYTNV